MRARIAETICCLLALLLTGCVSTTNLYDTFYTNEANHPLTDEEFIEKQYDVLYRGNMDVVINKKINLCSYRKMLFVRVSAHSTWLPAAVRNSVMRRFDENRFFAMVKTSQPVAYVNAAPFRGIGIEEDDVLWFSENDPVTLAWTKRFIQENNYIIADAVLNEVDIDAGLLRNYAFELKLLDSDDGAVIVSFLNRRHSLNKKPEAIIANTIERVNQWLARVGEICDGQLPPAPPPPAPDNCVYDK